MSTVDWPIPVGTKPLKINIKDLSVIVNMATNGNMVIVWVRKSQINTLTPLYK
jgi:hypothetical protein